MPELSAPPLPHSTNPTAKPVKPGATIQIAYPMACNAPDAMSAWRRENRSASAPEGTSAMMAAVDQIANSADTWACDRPLSMNNNA